MTLESYETRTVVSVSKIASQRLKNCLDPTSVLREKPRKPKDTHTNGRNGDRSEERRVGKEGRRRWGPAIAKHRRHRGSAIPCPSYPGAGDPLQGPPTAPFDCTLRRFDMFG